MPYVVYSRFHVDCFAALFPKALAATHVTAGRSVEIHGGREGEAVSFKNPPLTCHHPSVVQEGIRARRPGLDLKGVSEGVAVLHTACWQSIIPTVRRG